MSNFEDVSSTRKSEVWRNFSYCKATEKAKCNLCHAILKAAGSSTKGMITHLKSKHKISVKSSVMETSKEAPPKCKVRKIDSFFRPDQRRRDLDELLSQLTAVDGLTFNQIATSERLRRAFKADGYDLPRCHKQVRNLIIQHKEKIVKHVQEEFVAIKFNNGRFSITFDESTSARNRRYISLNVHFQGGFRSLGLIRIQGSMNAAQAIMLVDERLKCFGLDLDKDVVATVTDGASLMVKIGKDTSPVHVTCYAHAIHLAVCDILYKKPRYQPSDINDSEGDTEIVSDSEDENDSDEERITVAPCLSVDLQDVVKKVRNTVKIFRRSPVKNDENLQPFILEAFGKEKMLLLDCKTRWNSLLIMLERFYELRKEIKMALAQLDIQFDLSEEELNKINEMCEALGPFKVAVDALSSEKADLLLSEKIIGFVLKKLGGLKSAISKNLKERFWLRIDERRNAELIHLFEYLNKASFIDEPRDQLGHDIRRTKISQLAKNLLERLFLSNEPGQDITTEEREQTTILSGQDSQMPMSLAEELNEFIAGDDGRKNVICSAISSRLVQKEMMLYETSNKRPENLEKLYIALKTIKPTSVEAERAFSALGYFGSKIRNRLNDDTLDALMFLRHYYNK